MLGAIQKVENDLNAIKTLGEMHGLQHQLGGSIPKQYNTENFLLVTEEFVSFGEAFLDTLKLWLPLDIAASGGSGYGLNQLINKDKEQTNLRTSLTILGGSISGTVISGGTSYLYLKSKIKALEELGYDLNKDFNMKLPNLKTQSGEFDVELAKKSLAYLDKLVDQLLEEVEKGDNLDIIDPTQLEITKRGLNAIDSFFRLVRIMYYTSLAVGAANAYHGYKRNGGGGKGIGFGLLWFLFGGSTGLGVALSQGYGKEI